MTTAQPTFNTKLNVDNVMKHIHYTTDYIGKPFQPEIGNFIWSSGTPRHGNNIAFQFKNNKKQYCRDLTKPGNSEISKIELHT